MVKKIVFLFFFITSVFFIIPNQVIADECDSSKCGSGDNTCLREVYDNCSKKVNQLTATKNTLANQIKIIDSQIQLTLLKITQTENSIKTLEKEISNLDVEIGKLEVQINQLSVAYIHQTVQNYKLQKRIPAFAFLFSSNLNTFLEQQRYMTSVQKNSQTNLLDMETVRTNYDIQKTAKEKKQTELEALQKTLASQKISLNNQKTSKNSLLEVTKNNEAYYTTLLIDVQNKLSSLNNTSAKCLSSSPSRDNNYYSQLDPEWCPRYIGLQTKYTIGGAGCYLTSMCMVLKKIGFDITPKDYASDPKRFTASADMNPPIPPPGYTYKCLSIVPRNNCETSSRENILSRIDNELQNSRYAIVQVPMRGSPSGYHFITIISGSHSQYKMHDPIYGANLDFSSYYSVSSIVSLRLVTK